jgi:flagellar biosynthesis/type III secretory pathway M-ring protein FliF/YscJ
MESQTIAIALFSVALVISASLLIYYFISRTKPAIKKPLQKKQMAKPAAQKEGVSTSKSVQTVNIPILEIPPHIPRTLETIKIMAQERPEIISKVVRKWMDEWQKSNKP